MPSPQATVRGVPRLVVAHYHNELEIDRLKGTVKTEEVKQTHS